MTNVLIADDHPMVRKALGLTLRAALGDAQIVEVATQAGLEQQLSAPDSFDMVLLDLQMPGARGFSSLLQLRARRPELPVVVVSAHDRPRNISRARLYGAAAFISKGADVEQMQEALRAVQAGGSWWPPGADQAAEDAEQHELAARLAELTPQQLRVLGALAEGLLNKQIAHELGVTENTVKIHVSAILRKLGVGRRTQAALLARELMDAEEEINHIG